MSFRKSVLAAKSAVEDEDFAGALEHVETALRFNPNPESPQFFFLHGNVCFKLEKNEEAEKQLRTAVEMNPQFMPALTLLATMLQQTGRAEEYEDIVKRQIGIAKEKGNVKRLEELLLSLYGSRDKRKRHTDALDALRNLWDLGSFHTVQRTQVLSDILRLTELVSPGDVQALTTLYVLRLEIADDSDESSCCLDVVAAVLTLSLCHEDNPANTAAETCRNCLAVLQKGAPSEEKTLARSITLASLLFLREAAPEVVSASEAEGFAMELMKVNHGNIDPLGWRAAACLSSLSLAEGDLDAARLWNDQAVSRWKSSADGREAFVRSVIEANDPKSRRKGVRLGMEKDPNSLARLKRKSIRGIFFHLLVEGSVELWSCRAHLLLTSWIPNTKGYSALARAALASCERGIEFLKTLKSGIGLAPTIPQLILLSHAIRSATASQEHKKAAGWLPLLGPSATSLCLLAKADVALIYRQAYDDALSLYQQSAQLNQRPELTMAAHAGAASCLVTLERPSEAATLVPHFNVDIKQAESRTRELLEAKMLRHGTCVLPMFVHTRGVVELKQGDRKKAFMTVASAAKIDPFNAASFATLGAIYVVNGDEARALKCFEKCVGLDAACSVEALKALSELYVKKKDMVSVVRLYRTVIEELGHRMTKGHVLNGEMVQMAQFAWLRLGQAQYSKDKLLEARKSFQKVLSLSADRDRARGGGGEGVLFSTATIALADTYLRLHQYAAAQQTFESALGQVSDRAAAYVRLKLGVISLALGEPGEAVQHLQEAQQTELRVNNQASVLTLWHLVHAQADWIRGLINQNFLLRARSIFENEVTSALALLRSRLLDATQTLLRKLLPALSKLHADLVSLIAESFRVCESSASRHYAKAVLDEPWSGARWYDLAAEDAKTCLREEKDTALAQRLAKCAVLLDPTNSDVWNLLGVCYERVDKRRAVHCFCQATKLSPSNGDAWTNLASICLSTGKSEDSNTEIATMCVEKYQSVSMASEDNRSWTLRARVFARKGKLDAALAAAECAIPVDLDANEPRVVQRNACVAYLQSFLCKYQEGKEKPSERDNDVAILKDAILPLAKVHAELGFLAGLVHEYLGYFHEAIEYYKDAVDINEAACNLRIATCYYELGQTEECVKLVTGVKDLGARSLLGECLLRLDKAGDIDDTFPVLQRMKAALLKADFGGLDTLSASVYETEVIQRFCIKHGVPLPNVLKQQGPASLLLHAACGDVTTTMRECSKMCHERPWESTHWREMGTTLAQQAAPQRESQLEAAYMAAQAAHKAMTAARLVGSDAGANCKWEDEYYKGCICFFLAKISSARVHAQKAFFTAPWQTHAQRLLASCTVQDDPALAHGLMLNVQKGVKKKKIADILTLASCSSSYNECQELIQEAQQMITYTREDIWQVPLLQATAHIALARQSKQSKRHLDTTLQHYADALRSLPSSTELWSEVGCFAEAYRQDKASELCFKTARDIAGKSSSKDYVGVGTTMGALACVEAVHKSPKSGLEILGKASKRFPMVKELQAARGYLHLKSGQKEKAEEYFAKAEGLGVVPKLRQMGSQ